MSESVTCESPPGLSLGKEVAWYWQQLPNKSLWLCLLGAWLLLFQFLGNATLGYIETRSLFGWMRYAYSQHPDDEHGYLIPGLVLVMFWWKRRELLARVGEVWLPALAVISLAVVLHLVAYRVQQTRLSILAFALGIYGLLGLVWGRRFMASSFFPMVLFIFAIPLSTVSEALTYPLRILVAKIAAGIGHNVLALPVIRDGSRILGPEGAFDVAPACSGIRSLTALGAITMIYAFIGFSTTWKRLAVLAAAVPLAVAGNVARVTTVITMGDVFGQNLAMRMEQHLGMVTFAVALGCLFLLGRWLHKFQTP